MIYYIGDTHFGHANVIKHDGRPFQSVEEMDRALIENWNSRVTDKDDIYIVGDFAYRSGCAPEWYLKRLKGRKHLIIGNHDKITLDSKEAMQYFIDTDKMMHVKDGVNNICICHYPIAEWNGYYKGHYHIYAHIHNNLNDAFNIMKHKDKALNAGCMINNYIPVTFNELVENNKRFRTEHWLGGD